MFSSIQIDREIYASDEHQMVRQALIDFLNKEAIPHQEEWENEKCAPKSFWRKMGEQGFLCMDMPEEYGGGGFDFSFNAMVLEESRRMGVDFGLVVHSDIVAPYILRYGTEEQKRQYLPKMISGEWVGSIGMTEPSVGSDLKALKTVAEDKEDHYLVNGSKTFITNGFVADFVCCAVRTHKGTDQEGISLLIIDKKLDGFNTGQPFEKIGIKYQDTCELFFEDVKVPKSKLMGEEGMGFKYMMSDLPRERIGIAVESLGSAIGVLEKTIEYVKERKAFGKAISDFQNTQFKLADCAAEVQVYQSFLDKCVDLQTQHKLTTEQASIAKLKATEMHGKIVDECLQLFGGYGFIWEYDIARAYAGARVVRIYGGTSEIMKLIIARGLFKDHYRAQLKLKEQKSLS
ncbi:MAG: acyl-CoA dehydrogenase family protein [Saprospiraceae bacterium]|nr:acyl-CoA dehydrogenase family protein [Saprospiraceae bacterium]|tara:strand:- start:513 stop:1718 length:1206 start_codon:yes stop_codon:yes gene_type:complete